MDDLLILFITSLCVCFVMTKFIYPYILNNISKSATNIASKFGLKKGNEPLIVNALLYSPEAEDYKNHYPLVYIFDFNKNFIGSGYWEGVDTDTLLSISLRSPAGDNKHENDHLYNFVLNLYNTSDNMMQIIDFDKQFKIYIAYPNDGLKTNKINLPKV
ncbi:hypothetical protein SDC9_198612 [bioreactor metagenome]|uniref:Uncharacterized protein n=1 Tax=bioreactor metagenome TaxID=1076179 RepID=A0A645II57_9ZZZZ